MTERDEEKLDALIKKIKTQANVDIAYREFIDPVMLLPLIIDYERIWEFNANSLRGNPSKWPVRLEDAEFLKEHAKTLNLPPGTNRVALIATNLKNAIEHWSK